MNHIKNIYILAWSADSTLRETEMSWQEGRNSGYPSYVKLLPDGPCCSLPSERLLILHCSMNVEESLGFVFSNAAIKLY